MIDQIPGNESAEKRARIAQLRADILAIADKLDPQYGSTDAQEDFGDIRNVVQKKYGIDCDRYASYHILGGSSDYTAPNDDFPGDYSIEKLLEALQSRYEERLRNKS